MFIASLNSINYFNKHTKPYFQYLRISLYIKYYTNKIIIGVENLFITVAKKRFSCVYLQTFRNISVIQRDSTDDREMLYTFMLLLYASKDNGAVRSQLGTKISVKYRCSVLVLGI